MHSIGLFEQCILYQNINLRWSTRKDIGSVLQKNWRGLVLSLQQHEKIRRKQLFQATLTLCRLLLVNDHTSQPYIRVGRQYVLSQTISAQRSCRPSTVELAVNWWMKSVPLWRGSSVGRWSRWHKMLCYSSRRPPRRENSDDSDEKWVTWRPFIAFHRETLHDGPCSTSASVCDLCSDSSVAEACVRTATSQQLNASNRVNVSMVERRLRDCVATVRRSPSYVYIV